MKRSLYSLGVAVLLLAASGPSSAAPLDIPALCGDEGFEDHPENRIYRGSFRSGKLETALVITPVRDEDGSIEVFYLYGEQPDWGIDEAGCAIAHATEKGKQLKLRLGNGARVIYKFSGDKATVRYKLGGRVTPGKVTLSDM